MHSKLYRRLEQLDNLHGRQALHNSLVGLEKENLRVTSAGKIPQTDHPKSLGSALTHSRITTDYSEALLELITPPFRDLKLALDDLDATARFVYANLDDELLWATSMPCVVAGEDSVRIAEYGDSNAGRMKHIYRRGLGYRYGKIMQAIAGVHYNYSFSKAFWVLLKDADQDSRSVQDYISDNYLSLARNFLRCSWLIPYLFGASPAVCKSFFDGGDSGLEEWNSGTVYAPYATSLRISDFGYQNRKSCDPQLAVSYNSLQDYIAGLQRLTQTPHPDFKKIGVKVDGEYRQLNDSWLQIENEYYSPIRLKQISGRYEKPTCALNERGVQYVEIRALDVNAFEPLGVCEQQLRFLELLMAYCLLQDSKPLTAVEVQAFETNMQATAMHGRAPDAKLVRDGKEVLLLEWAREICHHLEPIAEVFDADTEESIYSDALKYQVSKIADPDLTPSAKILAEMGDREEGFFQFAFRQSLQHQEYFKSNKLTASLTEEMQALSQASIEEQQKIEASDTQDFDQFLAEYLAS